MTLQFKIPGYAFVIDFTSRTGRGKYYIWAIKGGKWCWDALGNGGQENTRDEAEAAARRWIRDGDYRRND